MLEFQSREHALNYKREQIMKIKAKITRLLREVQQLQSEIIRLEDQKNEN